MAENTMQSLFEKKVRKNIASLSLYMSRNKNWVLRACVLLCEKHMMRSKDLCLRIFLVDTSGIAKATLFNNDSVTVEEIFKQLTPGKTVAVSNASITDPSKNDPSKARSLSLTMGEHSLPLSNKELSLGSGSMEVLDVGVDADVLALSQCKSEMKKLQEAFKDAPQAGVAVDMRIADIPAECDEGAIVNVTGRVLEMYGTKMDEAAGWKRRSIKIGDSSGHCIDLTLWNDLVDRCEKEDWDGKVLYVCGVKIHWYGGVQSLTPIKGGTAIEVDNDSDAHPDISINCLWVDVSRSQMSADVSVQTDIIAARRNDALISFYIVAQFESLGLEKCAWYNGCPNAKCARKVNLMGDAFVCITHNQVDTVCYKYNFQVTVRDTKGNEARLVCFDRMGTLLMGYGLSSEPKEFPAQNFNSDEYADNDDGWMTKMTELFQALKGDPDNPKWFKLRVMRKKNRDGFVSLTLNDFEALDEDGNAITKKRKRNEYVPYTGESKQSKLRKLADQPAIAFA